MRAGWASRDNGSRRGGEELEEVDRLVKPPSEGITDTAIILGHPPLACIPHHRLVFFFLNHFPSGIGLRGYTAASNPPPVPTTRGGGRGGRQVTPSIYVSAALHLLEKIPAGLYISGPNTWVEIIEATAT